MEASSLFRVWWSAIQNKNDSRGKIPSKDLREIPRALFESFLFFFSDA
jgi:hypothetical protein